MLRQFFANFTWLDICVALLIVRGCWIGFQKGFLVEVFKSFGLLFAVFIGMHFYLPCGHFLAAALGGLKPTAHILSYVFLTGVTIGVFRIVRDGMIVLFRDKDEECSVVSRVTALVLGFCRGLVLSSLLLSGCLIAEYIPLTRTVRHSFSTPNVLSVSPRIYSGIFRFIVSPVFPGEEENKKISALIRVNKRLFD